MKSCLHCGGDIDERTGRCTKCGSYAANNLNQNQAVQVNKGNKKNNKKIIIVIVSIISFILIAIACVLTVALLSGADNEENTVQQPEISPSEFSLNYDTGYELSDELYDYQVMIDNTVYQFPMNTKKFMATGLVVSEYYDPNELISPGYTEYIRFVYPDGSNFVATVANFAKSEAPISDCHIVGVTLNSKDNPASNLLFDTTKIKMAKNITLGISSYEDVIAAYGEPTDTSMYEEFGKIVYEQDLYNSIKFSFNDSNILDSIDIENIEQPDDVVERGVSGETPAKVSNYTAPSFLGNDIASGVVELEGDLYKLPVPLSELLDNGWQITSKSSNTIAGLDIEYVDISKGNVTLDHLSLNNDENYEVALENGIIEDLSSTSFEYGKEGSLILPGKVTVGSSEELVMEALKGHQYTTKETSWDITYYVENGYYTAAVSVEDGTVQYVSVNYFEL